MGNDPGRAPTDGPLTFEELQLATRNRGNPLEALRYDLTPTGLHYLLIHFDIPAIEADGWRLSVGGRVRRPLELSLPALRRLPERTIAVTLAQPFEGYQPAIAYHYQRDEEDGGEPVERIRVPALMVPPGIPDFFTRARIMGPGRHALSGRAWSGEGDVARVEVAVDGEWSDARLDPSLGEYAWRGWSFEWDATMAEHELACRATDAAGKAQPLEQPWNYQGMGQPRPTDRGDGAMNEAPAPRG